MPNRERLFFAETRTLALSPHWDEGPRPPPLPVLDQGADQAVLVGVAGGFPDAAAV